MPPSDETTFYGLNASLAVFRHRPQDIRRVYYTERRRLDLRDLLQATAAARRPYREVDDEALEKITRTRHHEGVAVVAAPLPTRTAAELAQLDDPQAVLIALDAIGNPHNLGAILRSAAWFGATGVIVPREPRQATLSPTAARVSQGGAELVPCYAVDNLPKALRGLTERGVAVVGAEQRTRESIFSARLEWPLCVVLGNEGEGLSKATRAACPRVLSIPGTGAIESLNVSVAAGVVLAAATRTPRGGKKRGP